MNVIDFRARPRTPYYYKRIVPTPHPAYEQYFKIYHMEDRLTLAPLEESIKEMVGGGVTRAVIHSGNADGFKQVYEDYKKFPDVLIPITDIDLSQGVTQSMTDLEFAYKEYNFRGITLSPFFSGIYATDPRYYPLYALSEKMGRMVQLHSSVHFNPMTPIDIGDPAHLDKVAVHFPGLKFVLSHGGTGFGQIGLIVAQRRPNVWIDFSGLRPRYLPPDVVHAINTYLADKAIFGTNYPSLPYDIVDEWKQVVRDKVQPRFFYENAARVLGLDD